MNNEFKNPLLRKFSFTYCCLQPGHWGAPELGIRQMFVRLKGKTNSKQMIFHLDPSVGAYAQLQQ